MCPLAYCVPRAYKYKLLYESYLWSVLTRIIKIKSNQIKKGGGHIHLSPFEDVFVAFWNSQGLQNVTCLLVDNWSLVHAANLCATMTTGCWLLPRRVLAPPPFWGWGYFEVIYNKLHSFMPFIYMQTGVNWQEKEKEIVALKLLKWFTTRGVLRDLQISIFVCPGQGLDVWTVGPGGGRREKSCFEVEVIYSRRQPSSGVSGGDAVLGHTSYLSILVHRRIIEVYKKYTKKLSELATK